MVHQDENFKMIQTARLIQQKRFQDVDTEWLQDLVLSMAKREKREVLSRGKQLILHLLKWKYQPALRSTSWESSILQQRMELEEIFVESSSLLNVFVQELEKIYRLAKTLASVETHLPLQTFPLHCEWSVEELLNQEFWPK